MGLSDNVAIVALVVSLIALVISLGQLSQAFLGTAEGYRRCKREVIGSWSAGTRRVWHWSEFRYETTYTTPEIDLLPTSKFELLRDKRKKNKDVGPFRLNAQEGDAVPIELQGTIEVEPDLSDELLVSWISLLRELHSLYDDYWTRKFFAVMRYQMRMDTIDHALPVIEKYVPTGTTGIERTEIVVSKRRLSWDFMPADVVRPLALTYLGPLIIMGIRLGMRWQALGLKDDTIRASGSGYSITSTTARGVGLIVQFNAEIPLTHLVEDDDSATGLAIEKEEASATRRQKHDLIPSQAVDKMMCGILPVDPALIPEKNYALVDDEGLVSRALDLLGDLGVSNDVVELMSQSKLFDKMRWWEATGQRAPFNDAVTMLCPFLPLPDSDCRTVHFFGWLGKYPLGTTVCYEGRLIYLLEISQKVRELGDGCPEKLMLVHGYLTELEQEYPDQFYGDKSGNEDETPPEDHGRMQFGGPQELVTTCRRAFDATTKYFQDLEAGTDGRGRLPFKLLVAAHVSHVARAHRWLTQRSQELVMSDVPAGGPGGLYLLSKPDRKLPLPAGADPETWRVRLMNERIADMAWACTADLEGFVDEVRMQAKGDGDLVPHSSLDIEEAWWMLILRGVCWAMSIRIDYHTEVIPSSFYQNRTPVFIT